VSDELVRARVRVPCSTSNLGSGFDCIGLAFDRHIDVSFTPEGSRGPEGTERPDRADGSGLRIERAGTLARLPPGVEGDAVAAAFRSRLGLPPDGMVRGVLSMTSAIPIARGLGSSAAATVAGLLLADAANGRRIEPASLLDPAADVEGHPDNVAPALLGGLVAVATGQPVLFAGSATGAPGRAERVRRGVAAGPVRAPGYGTAPPTTGAPAATAGRSSSARDLDRPAGATGRRAFRLPLSPDLGFAFAAPPIQISTALAREALPADVPHATAVRALSRTVALVRGLASGDPDLLRIGFADELHVPWRLPLIPDARAAIEAGIEAGAFAVTISGSGSGLIAVTPLGQADAVAAAMAASFRVRPADTAWAHEVAAAREAAAGDREVAAGDGYGTAGDRDVIEMTLRPDFEGARVLEFE